MRDGKRAKAGNNDNNMYTSVVLLVCARMMKIENQPLGSGQRGIRLHRRRRLFHERTTERGLCELGRYVCMHTAGVSATRYDGHNIIIIIIIILTIIVVKKHRKTIQRRDLTDSLSHAHRCSRNAVQDVHGRVKGDKTKTAARMRPYTRYVGTHLYNTCLVR